ncbi:MAG: hypothetical protein JKY27_08355 [Magnetovibrio sp.]|nr:hypothetical protein [Magnetovibrio sp.]
MGNEITHLADNLVHHLGVEDALRICRENSWDGVMLEIQDRLNESVQH